MARPLHHGHKGNSVRVPLNYNGNPYKLRKTVVFGGESGWSESLQGVSQSIVATWSGASGQWTAASGQTLARWQRGQVIRWPWHWRPLRCALISMEFLAKGQTGTQPFEPKKQVNRTPILVLINFRKGFHRTVIAFPLQKTRSRNYTSSLIKYYIK